MRSNINSSSIVLMIGVLGSPSSVRSKNKGLVLQRCLGVNLSSQFKHYPFAPHACIFVGVNHLIGKEWEGFKGDGKAIRGGGAGRREGFN